MRNKYGILLPIEINLPIDFVSGSSILDYISEETKNYLFDLAKKVKDVRSNECGINVFSKLPLIHLYNPNIPADLLTYGTVYCGDDGVGVFHIAINNENYKYTITIYSDNRIVMDYLDW